MKNIIIFSFVVLLISVFEISCSKSDKTTLSSPIIGTWSRTTSQYVTLLNNDTTSTKTFTYDGVKLYQIITLNSNSTFSSRSLFSVDSVEENQNGTYQIREDSFYLLFNDNGNIDGGLIKGTFSISNNVLTTVEMDSTVINDNTTSKSIETDVYQKEN